MRNILAIRPHHVSDFWDFSPIASPLTRMLSTLDEVEAEYGPAGVPERAMRTQDFEVRESEQAYLLSMDLPGVKKDDLKIELVERTLTISGERRGPSGSTSQLRRYVLPKSVDVEKIEARLEDGVLQLALPKAEVEKPRTIKIGSGSTGVFAKLMEKFTPEAASTPSENQH